RASWQAEGGVLLREEMADVIRYGILACAREPFDPMEKAFYALGEKAFGSPGDPHLDLTLLREYGLRPELLAVTNLWEPVGGGSLLAAIRGAREAVAGLCSMSSEQRGRLPDTVDRMARRGMRILAVARATLPAASTIPESVTGLPFEFLGLVGLADPLRP